MEQVTEFLENFGYMTFSNGSFWMGFTVIAAVILVYQLLLRFVPGTVAPVHRFFQRHPLIWICIPAALLIYFVYVSLGWNLWVSVSNWESGQLEASYGWGGFGNYVRMFSSPDFWPSLRNTLLLFCLIPLCLLLGLGLALIMDQGLRGTALFRTLILLPFALSFVVTGTVWAYMYRPTGGVLNSFLSLLGVNVSAAMKNGHLMWASSNSTIMLSIIIAMVWQFSGYVAVIRQAGRRLHAPDLLAAHHSPAEGRHGLLHHDSGDVRPAVLRLHRIPGGLYHLLCLDAAHLDVQRSLPE